MDRGPRNEAPPASEAEGDGAENGNNQNTEEISPRLAALQEELWAFTNERPKCTMELAILAAGALRDQYPIAFRWYAEMILNCATELLEEEAEYGGRSAAHFRQLSLRREKYEKHSGRWPDPAAAGLRYVEFALARARDHMAECSCFEARAYACASWLRLTPRERREIIKATAERARDED